MTKAKSVLLWILAFLLMLTIAIYQRVTGPTYPIGGDFVARGFPGIEYSMPRSHGGDGDAMITLIVPDKTVSATMEFKRFKSHDTLSVQQLRRSSDTLVAAVPHQPPAGKVIYQVFAEKNGDRQSLTSEPVIIRFKGAVPYIFLIPHVLFMFLAMSFSLRTGFEVLFKGKNVYRQSIYTAILLLIGGLILGPVIQYYAFGALWTGWPLGHDLTDNKTIVAFVVWLIAIWRLRKDHNAKGWALAASIILLAVYLIPHSVLGSEIDYTKIPGN